MVSLWILLLYVMADVMQGRGHGGDGAEDPPPPGGYGRGHHESDPVQPRKVRGKAKNLRLAQEVKQKGGPLSLPFDRNATFTPVGELNDWFTREVGIYMWGHIAFDQSSWKYVSPAEKNALNEHLKRYFDLDEIKLDRERAQLTGGIDAVIQKRYRDRKANAKQYFLKHGGYDDVTSAMGNPPDGMTAENWRKTVDYFLTDAHKTRSTSNTSNRQQQQYANLGGTSTYSSYCYKKNKGRLDAYYNAHTHKDGTFYNDIAEGRYNDLKAEFENQTDEVEDEFLETAAPPPNEVEVFEKVLGTRRGHIRGVGRKPSTSATPSFVGHHEQNQTPQSFSQDQIASLFEDQGFKDQLLRFMATQKPSNKGNEDDSDDGNE